MPDFLFKVPDNVPVPAGCVERVCIRVPWSQPQRAKDQNGHFVINPQNGQFVVLGPPQLAWSWLSQQQGLFWVPGVNYEFKTTNPASQCEKPMIYCLQDGKASVDRAQYNAPYAHPVGNGQGLTMPPAAAPANDPSKALSHGQYDPIDPSGLANSSDPLLGGSDGLDGTFSDTSFDGREELRQTNNGMFGRPAGPRPHERAQGIHE